MVQSAGGTAAVQLRHAGGPVERRLHLRRDVQEEVSEKRAVPRRWLSQGLLETGEASARARVNQSLIHIFTPAVSWRSVARETGFADHNELCLLISMYTFLGLALG